MRRPNILPLYFVMPALTGVLFLASAAVPPATKGKAPATSTAAKSSKQAAPAKKQTAAPVATAGTAKPKATTTSNAARSKAPAARRPTTTTTNSKAVYSRSGRTQSARRTPATTRSQTYWQSRPTPDRYREIQQALAEKGFFKGEVNGTWSTDSVEALKNFQKAENLDPDGKLGSLSLIALGLGPKRIAAATPTPPPPPQPPPSTPPENPNRQP